MRFSIALAFGIWMAAGSVAQAQQPLDPYDIAPFAPPVYRVPPVYIPPVYYAPPPPPIVVAPAYPLPPPVYVIPRLARHQRVYVAPPMAVCPTCACPVNCVAPPVYVASAPAPLPAAPVVVQAAAKPLPKARFFSLGGRFVGMGINQQINDKTVLLWGGGVQARFRSRGRFALELSVDFMENSFKPSGKSSTTVLVGNGGAPGFSAGKVTRDSVPFSLSLMGYIFPNSDERHFNMYFFGGGGIVATAMTLSDEWGGKAKQSFLEYEAHLGLGAELRFKWFALEANLRGIGLFRENSYGDAPYYRGVSNGPVPKMSWGALGSVAASFWF